MDSWDAAAEGWDEDDNVRDFAEEAFGLLSKHLDIQGSVWRDKRVLDFGCGTGLLTERLAPLVREVIALDTSPSMIDVLRSKGIANVTTVCGDIDDRAFRQSASWLSDLDLIVASSVCAFLPDYASTLKLLSQAMCMPGYFAQWDWLATGDGTFGLTADQMAAGLEQAGLTCTYLDTVFSMTLEEDELTVLMGIAVKE